MSTKTYDYPAIEDYVLALQEAGVDVYWDGWDVVIFWPDVTAYDDPKAVVRNGKFGYARRVAVNERGFWEVPIE